MVMDKKEMSHIEKMRNLPDYADGYVAALRWVDNYYRIAFCQELAMTEQMKKEYAVCVD
jgi:hypothetical protein